MRAVVKKEPGKSFVLEDVKEPKIVNSKDVKLKILKVSVCGTDLHIWKWDEWSQNRIKPPQINGHECVGEVVEIGKEVKGVKVGDIVTCETHIPCGVCYQCKTGNMHVCKDMQILGVDRDGVWAEYAVVPEVVVWKVDKKIPLKYVSVMEPLGNAIFTATSFDLRGKYVLITGAGPIGAMAINVAQVSGAAAVIVSEVSEYRINMAKELGADLVINPMKQDLIEEVNKFTDGHGADVLLEMSGNVKALNDGINAVRNAGEVAVLAVYKGNTISFEMNTAVFKNLTIKAVTGRKMFETWHIASQWLKYNRLKLDKIVTHEFDLSEFEKALQLMNEGKSGKIVLNVAK
ncbi:L-threonine 3-dehydrogenase [Tepiditoga spiralis]|uniref:L-threonine 3-dehydrogenase n=1 Tax=Tepiditoga spiralis TaxID=2108365 RepID=A0A7G1G0U9_9BACT|nr:L-threonine 3-dehydrogenase [Tepiditoga spiralis]BBE29861.1 L-threonine 3-dehydrogenase [Tepiditoga spiralis]